MQSNKLNRPLLWWLSAFALMLTAELAQSSKANNTEANKTDYQLYNSCKADNSWIANPSLPVDVGSEQTNCNFHQFMWQSLLYLVQPNRTGSNVLEFETWMPTYGLFVGPNELPKKWGSIVKPNYCKGFYKPEANYIFSDLTLQAGAHKPLIDKSLNNVFYNISVNKPAYDFITSCNLYKAQCALTLAPDLLSPGDMKIVDIPKKYPNLAFPDQSIELKTSWKILNKQEQASNTFYTTRGSVKSPGKSCQENVVLGLIGLHIVSKTPTHPEFIWATFEHRNNAPECNIKNAKPPLGGDWSLYDKNCQGDCTTNKYIKGKSTQVCRMHPWGDPVKGEFPNNLNCNSIPPPAYICSKDVRKYIIDTNTQNLISINNSVSTMLQRLPSGNRNRLWKNYALVGNVWTINGELPPNLQSQRGSLSSANTSMETYVQNGGANVTNPNNCFSCHNQNGKTQTSSSEQGSNPVSLPQAGLSHIFNLLNIKTKGCEKGKQLPAACSSYNNFKK